MSLLALLLASTPAILTGGGSAFIVLLVNKIFQSSNEKSVNTRQDFDIIASNLFKEIEYLKSELHRYKADSDNCEKQYKELQEKFLDFKTKYSELELRYNIQININKKLADEIKSLEEQISQYIENEKQEPINTNTTGITK